VKHLAGFVMGVSRETFLQPRAQQIPGFVPAQRAAEHHMRQIEEKQAKRQP
jgi:hypothetical protein